MYLLIKNVPVQAYRPKRSLKSILVENSTYRSGTHKLKKRLIREKYFEHKCYCCGNTEWMGKIIPLELEHINGINTDHSLINLTLLCPNCHAQTSTYRGKNKRNPGSGTRTRTKVAPQGVLSA